MNDKKCKHQEATEIGRTIFEGFSAYVMWCKNCGAYRVEQNCGEYKNSKWRLPREDK